jgi:hypothetical protein
LPYTLQLEKIRPLGQTKSKSFVVSNPRASKFFHAHYRHLDVRGGNEVRALLKLNQTEWLRFLLAILISFRNLSLHQKEPLRLLRKKVVLQFDLQREDIWRQIYTTRYDNIIAALISNRWRSS